jgi:hypothetical protein
MADMVRAERQEQGRVYVGLRGEENRDDEDDEGESEEGEEREFKND